MVEPEAEEEEEDASVVIRPLDGPDEDAAVVETFGVLREEHREDHFCNIEPDVSVADVVSVTVNLALNK